MTSGLTHEAAVGAGANLSALYPTHLLAGWQTIARKLGARAVVIDSISKTHRPLTTTVDACEWARRTGHVVLLVAHENKRGQASGSTAIEHEPDTVIRVHSPDRGTATVTVEKRRASPGGSVRVTVTDGSGAPTPRPRGPGATLRLVR
jgi:predicted ATP-dependent serine protease